MGISFFGFLIPILIFLGGNLGIPLGMAPGPEDPMLSKLAPEDCVLYASWSGVTDVDAKANPTEAWISQPKVRAAGNKLRKAYWDMVSSSAAKNGDPIPTAASQFLVEVGRIASLRPGAIYANRLYFTKGNFGLRGGVIVSLGDHRAKIQKQFDELVAKLPKFSKGQNEAYQVKVIDGEKVIRVAAPQFDFEVNFKMHGEYFFVGLGEDSIAELKKNQKTEAPKWLVELRETLKIDRVSSVAFVNSKQLYEEVKDFDGIAKTFLFDDMYQVLVDAKSVGWVSGVDSKGFLTRVDIRKDKSKSGLLTLIERDPIPKRFIKEIPRDATVAVATRISSEQILKLLRQTTASAGEEAIEDSLGEFQKFTGVKLEEELLESVDDFFYAYYKFDMAKLMKNTGWVISVRIEDEMSFPAIFDRLNSSLKKWAKGREEHIKFGVQKEGLYDIYSLVPADNITYGRFAWAVVDDQWFFAAIPEDIVEHLKGAKGDEANLLLSDPLVKEIYEFGDQSGFGAPVTILNVDVPEVIKQLMTFVIGMTARDDRIEPELDFLWSDVPPVVELTKDAHPNISAIYRTETGFQMYQRQTYPGASPIVTISAASALWLVDQSTRVKQK